MKKCGDMIIINLIYTILKRYIVIFVSEAQSSCFEKVLNEEKSCKLLISKATSPSGGGWKNIK